MSSTFDTEGFWQAIDAVRRERGLAWYAVWRQTFVDNVASAEKRKRTPNKATRATLAEWAGIDASRFERQAAPVSSHPVSRDEQETHVSWLAKQGLLGRGGVR